jgi:hypothetical protein
MTIEMDATVENHRRVEQFVEQLDFCNVVNYSLSSKPKVGETWKDERGVICVIEDNSYHSDRYLLAANGESYDEDGSWDSDVLSSRHLVEFVAERKELCKVKVGEYWKDRIGNIYLIDEIDRCKEYAISDTNGTTWDINGSYHIGTHNHSKDLVARVTICGCD